MSTQIKEVLKNFLYTTDETCFLCFSNLQQGENGIRVSDEILYEIDAESKNTKVVLEMLTGVLGAEITLNMCNDDLICANCLQLCINAYQFIEASKWNVNLMKHLIVNATNAVEQIYDTDFSNTAFLLISPNSYSSQAYLDRFQFLNTKQAIAKFKHLVKKPVPKASNDYLCNICYKGFATLLEADEHSKNCQNAANYISNAGADSPTHDDDIKVEPNESFIYIAPSNFECKHCFAEFKKFSRLQDHCKTEHGDCIEDSGLIVDSKHKMSYIVISEDDKEIYQCSQCMSTYSSYHSLHRHYIATHNKNLSKPLGHCVVCGEQFETKSLLRQHQKAYYTTYNKDDTKVYECKMCNSTFNLYRCLTRHFELLHNKDKPAVVSRKKPTNYCTYEYGKICVVCEEIFEKKSLWKKHLEIHYHTLSRNNATCYQCDICMETFSQYYSIIRHFNRAHNNAGVVVRKPRDDHGLICTFCGKVFKDKTRRRKHEECHQEKTLQCDVCHKFYRNEHSFKNHLCNPNNARLIRIKNLECDYCGRMYSKKLALQTHIRYMHLSEGIFCSVCNKRCENKRNLQDHLLVHTKEKNFECTVCGGKFGVKAALKTHMRLHTGETPYPCEECDKAFISSSRRADHYRRHHSERTKVCDICSKKFYMAKDLKRHRERHFNRDSSLYNRRSAPVPADKQARQQEVYIIQSTVKAPIILRNVKLDMPGYKTQ